MSTALQDDSTKVLVFGDLENNNVCFVPDYPVVDKLTHRGTSHLTC